MFIGHFAVGFGAKTITPKLSLGTLFLAVQFVDLLWPTLLLLGIEHVEIEPGNTAFTPLNFSSYPISHSLLMVCLWAVLFAGVYWFRRKDVKAAIVLGLCVLSHWLLDLITHRPDLPLYPGESALVGLGLWNSIVGTAVVESLAFAVGVWLYTRATKPLNRAGSFGLWGLIAFLAVVYLGNLFGPTPPSVSAIAWAGQLQWLFIFWAYWVDRNRS